MQCCSLLLYWGGGPFESRQAVQRSETLSPSRSLADGIIFTSALVVGDNLGGVPATVVLAWSKFGLTVRARITEAHLSSSDSTEPGAIDFRLWQYRSAADAHVARLSLSAWVLLHCWETTSSTSSHMPAPFNATFRD